MGFISKKISHHSSPFIKDKKTASRPKLFFGPSLNYQTNKNKIFSKKLFIWLITTIVVFLYIGWGINSLLTPPKVTIFSPEDNYITKERIIVIKGNVNEKALIKINDQIINLDNQNNFEEKISLSPGINNIKISASKKISKEYIIFRQIIAK